MCYRMNSGKFHVLWVHLWTTFVSLIPGLRRRRRRKGFSFLLSRKLQCAGTVNPPRTTSLSAGHLHSVTTVYLITRGKTVVFRDLVFFHLHIYTVDREIFALKIICSLNFRVKSISSLDGSASQRVSAFYFFAHLIFVVPHTDENILTAKFSRSTVYMCLKPLPLN